MWRSLVEDGATLQMGIGGMPNAVLAALGSHKNLGIHTEMFSDGAIDLIEKGVVNNERKRIHPGKVVGAFAMGTRRLYDFIDDNPQVVMLDVAYVNDTAVIRRNPKVTAINSAIEVDLTGQVGADSMGTRMYSGVGGQMDFVRGAALSEGGKPIIALPAVTSKGVTRIVPFLRLGSGVVTDARPRALRGHRVRHRLSLRPQPAAASTRAHRGRRPRPTRQPRRTSLGALQTHAGVCVISSETGILEESRFLLVPTGHDRRPGHRAAYALSCA